MTKTWSCERLQRRCRYSEMQEGVWPVKSSTDYVDMLHSLSCKLLIDKPTRITKHSTTVIDHIYTNDVKSSIVSGVYYNG